MEEKELVKRIEGPVKVSGIWLVALAFIALLSLITVLIIRHHGNDSQTADVNASPAASEALPTPAATVKPESTPTPSLTPNPVTGFSKTAVLVAGNKTVVLASREAAEELIRNVERHFLSAGSMPDNVVTELSTPIELVHAEKDDETVSYEAAFSFLTGRSTPIIFLSKATFVDEISVPHSVETIEDDSFPAGYRVVEIYGRDGVERNTHEVNYKNGIMQADSIVESVTLLEPVDSRIRAGTMELPEDFELGFDYGEEPEAAAGLTFIAPVRGDVLKFFGPDENSFHQGIDIFALNGSEIVAACSGTVVSVMVRGSYGLVVEIDHGSGIVTRYARLASASVSIGDTVNTGDVIGVVLGDMYLSFLHFELRIMGVAYNPLKVIPLKAFKL